MSLQAHISELEAKHNALKAEIETEQAHPSADDLHIHELKRQKLRLKDEIARLRAETEAA
ncbi:MAG: DUF465 domain-containing protein [Rhizobiales bacterium]|nr:DUF465 domain-containing protein [Hyphomicrobiales bacterium]NNE21125.1 DUF465 domain-containing protein [Hyphomicrobiales bacterium]